MKKLMVVWWLIQLALKTRGDDWHSSFRWPYLRRFQPKNFPIRLERYTKDLAVGMGFDVPVELELHFVNLPGLVLSCTVNEDGTELLTGDRRPYRVYRHILKECEKKES